MHKIIIAFIILFGVTIGDVVLKENIEAHARSQARYNLGHVEACMKLAVWQGNSPSKAQEFCTSKMRTSITGDMYILRVNDLAFVQDKSRDIPLGLQLYFTPESIGVEFDKRGSWESGLRSLPYMISGFDSQPGQNIWYNYDGNKEWLEWIFLNNNKLKYSTEIMMALLLDENNKKAFNYRNIVFDDDIYRNDDAFVYVQGIQSDEALEEFKLIRYSFFTVSFIISIVLIIMHIREHGKLVAGELDYGGLCNNDDCEDRRSDRRKSDRRGHGLYGLNDELPKFRNLDCNSCEDKKKVKK